MFQAITYVYQQAFTIYQLCARNTKNKIKTRNNCINWLKKYSLDVLYAIPNLDILNMFIRKTQSLQECSTSCKWAIAKLGPNKPLLMRGADRIIERSKEGKFLW